jgi:hypothetical protein
VLCTLSVGRQSCRVLTEFLTFDKFDGLELGVRRCYNGEMSARISLLALVVYNQ